MSTPRTDAREIEQKGAFFAYANLDLARQLERELNAANEKLRVMHSALDRIEGACHGAMDGIRLKGGHDMVRNIESFLIIKDLAGDAKTNIQKIKP